MSDPFGVILSNLKQRIGELEDQRRERIATAALAGLIAHSAAPILSEDVEASHAVRFADALIAALDAKTDTQGSGNGRG